jgi:hypothetical protein
MTEQCFAECLARALYAERRGAKFTTTIAMNLVTLCSQLTVENSAKKTSKLELLTQVSSLTILGVNYLKKFTLITNESS